MTSIRKTWGVVGLLTVMGAWASAALLGLLVVLQAVDVITRNATGSSSVRGLPEYIAVGLGIIVFLSIGFAEREGAHVRTPLLTSRLPRGIARPSRAIALTFGAGILVVLAFGSLQRALDAFQTGEVAPGIAEVSTWPTRFAVPVGALLMAVELLRRALADDPSQMDIEEAVLAEGNVL